MKDLNIFSLISKYRTELMGYATLGVFICHCVLKTDFHSFITSHLPRLVYTQGFLFLSGFGLYYSFSKDSRIFNYFKKRIYRVFFPYVLMAFPFLLIIILKTHQGVEEFLGYLTTLSFWIKGSYYGMWYIPIILAMYLIFPLLYELMFKRLRGNGGGISVLILYCLLIWSLYLFFPDYWEMNGRSLKKTVMFPLGMYCAFLSKHQVDHKWQWSFYLSLLVFLVLTKLKFTALFEYARSLFGIFTIPIVLLLLEINKIMPIVSTSLRWLGNYSLELYLLHMLIYWTAILFTSIPEVYVMLVSILLALIICVPVHKFIGALVKL